MGERVFAVLGVFAGPDALLDAASKLEGRGVGKLEAYTPYPVHGLGEALALRRSPLAGMVMVMGTLGTAAAFLFQWWMNAYDYPIVVGGKPLASWQAFVPIMFEVTVLFSAFTAWLGAVFLLCRLPGLWHPMLSSSSMPKLTRDRFALSIESQGRDFDAEATREALRDAGALETEVVRFPPAPKPASLTLLLGLAGAGALACVVAGLATYWTIKVFPTLPPMSRMLQQPRLGAQRSSSVFAGSAGFAPVAEGTVARGRLPYPFKTPEEAAVLGNPLPRTKAVLAEGKRRFDTVCRVCHGPLADGKGTLTKAYGASPADLRTRRYQAFPDGSVYHAIMSGKNAMPSFAKALTEDERWSIIHYLRALQRAADAKDSDLP
ncbi:MAG: DUF3341 domain-containing protein [Elusimicrobia bacterium]|nr:DUF3341 domain-containing protein [Elusimicrobiota bacterium]